MNIAGNIGIILLNTDILDDFEQIIFICVVKFENQRLFQLVGEIA